MSGWLPWLAVAGVGAMHGLNPTTGWLFAAARGVRTRDSGQALSALMPIAVGHAASVALVAAAVASGLVMDRATLRWLAGGLFSGIVVHQLWRFVRRHRRTPGGPAALALWSLMISTAHGSGLMLVPALIPLCLSETPAREITASGSMALALAAVGVHTAAMLAVTGAIAVVACRGISPQWQGRTPRSKPGRTKEILMRISNLILAGALALPEFSGKVWAAELTNEQAALEECGAYSQAGMRECQAKKSDESSAALKRAEDQAVAALSRWDEDARFIHLAKEKLRASSKAYERYRDAQCAFAASLGGGAIGNALEMRRLSCRIGLNNERARQFTKDVFALPSK